MNHTPEPWRVESRGMVVAPWSRDPRRVKTVLIGQDSFGEGEEFANADRAAACVNACKGIEDPERTIVELVACATILTGHIEQYRSTGHMTGWDKAFRDTRSVLAKMKGLTN